MTPIKLYEDLSIPLYVGEARPKRATPPEPPITYLTQWKIVGNSEVHGSEIWSCGEYNATDGKWHILVQPLGGSIADIALTEPLRKYGDDVADTIEFPSETEGKALVTRNVDVKTVSAYCNTDGTQIQTTLPDSTILHIHNIISSVQAISTTGLTITVNADSSLSLVGDNTDSSYIYRQIGNTNSRTSSDNYTYFAGIEGGGNSTFDFRYGGNVRVTTRHSVSKSEMNGDTLFFMLRAGANVNDTLYPTALDLNAMFADAPSLMPTTTSDFTTMFPNIKVIPFSNDVVDAIVHDGKLYKEDSTGTEILVPLATPTTELIDAVDIEESTEYSMVISQGAKAVSWSSFETE